MNRNDPPEARPGAAVDSNRRAATLVTWLRRALPTVLLALTVVFAWFEHAWHKGG